MGWETLLLHYLFLLILLLLLSWYQGTFSYFQTSPLPCGSSELGVLIPRVSGVRPGTIQKKLTPVSDTIFDALSHGTLGFALHGSYLNNFLIGENSSTANQIL